MDKIIVKVMSNIPHVSQIITGFHLLRFEYRVKFCNCIADNNYPNMAYVEAEYKGKTIIYDLLDGYQHAEDISALVNRSDFYFKRSYSEEKNQTLHNVDTKKIHPLGFNYAVTFWGSPVNYEPRWKSAIKPLFGKTPETYFNTKLFEGRASLSDLPPRILFLTRLWDENNVSTDKLQKERIYINNMRIDAIRKIRARYGDCAVAGLSDDAVSRRLAPDLIISDEYTNRQKYIELVHHSDICIGSMGLHESIGWKTGEYVAAAKSIVCEKMRYTVPGDFSEGINYLGFSTADECINAVDCLVQSPELRYQMKQNNERYYHQFLRPDVLVRNTLKIVDSI